MKHVINFKSYLKFLSRNKIYTGIEIFGLSVSLMFVILIGVYIKQEFSVDKKRPHLERIYIQGNEDYMVSAYGIGERLMDRFPEIEKVTYLSSLLGVKGQNKLIVQSEGRKQNAMLQFSYEDFFDFFDFDLAVGDKKEVMKNTNDAVISEKFARILFPNESPLGKTIYLDDKVNVTVSGIMKDIHQSVIPYCDILVRMEKLTEMYPFMNKDNFGNALNSVLFLVAREGADLPARKADIKAYFDEFYWIYAEGMFEEVTLTPLSSAYFDHYGEHTFLERGDKRFVLILLSVGILILLFAICNYINLTVAQTGFRAKEVAVRELLGSSKTESFNRLIAESTLLTFLSFMIGLLLAFLAVPYASQLLQTQIDIPGSFNALTILFIGVMILLLGAMAGVIPAFIMSRTKAVDVMKGAFRQKTKMVLSKFFITFQNTITIGMIIASIVMVLQIHHLVHAPLGYEYENVINIRVEDHEWVQARRFAEEIQQSPLVKGVGYASGTPFDMGGNQTTTVNDRLVGFEVFTFDQQAFDMFGFQILQDNNLSSGEGFFVSEHAFRETNLPHDTTAFEFQGDITPVAGVLKDFQLRTILGGNFPILVRLKQSNNDEGWFNNIVVKVQGDPVRAWNEVKSAYENVMQHQFTGRFIDQQIQEEFNTQKRMADIVVIFCFIAIVISLLGLLAMSTYFIQQRSREIAVRKVFGSENRQVLWKLVITFLNYVCIAFVIAVPFIYYIMREWLTGYSYRIHLHPWIFIAGGMCCMLMSFVTVFWQSYEAANRNPVESIKAE